MSTHSSMTGYNETLFSRRPVRVETETDIARTATEVFNFVSNAALWHTWHPATVSVRDVPKRPLTTGEAIPETITMGGAQRELLWTVVACDVPTRWEIMTDSPRGTAHIVYRLSATGTGCHFHRTLDFRSKGMLRSALDWSLKRRVFVRQSTQALANLKAVIERLGVA